MATETITLRPTSGLTGVSVTCYPTDTPSDSIYLLVCEENQDDEATYIVWDTLASMSGFNFTVPGDYVSKIPTSIKVYAVMYVDETIAEINLQYMATGDTYSKLSNARIVSETYVPYIFEIPTAEVSDFYTNSLINHISSYALTFTVTSTSTGSNSKNTTNYPHLTQLYLELTYQEDEDIVLDTIYLKENSSWTSIPCTIYQKQNGAWVTTDSSILENGDKFILQEIT